jgi:hypothetical protein
MKLLPIILLLSISAVTFGQVVAKPDAKLLDTAIQQYLKEMGSKFKIAPTEFIIEVADKSAYTSIKKKVGNTAILIKTKKELQDYSGSKTGKSIGFFVIDVEKDGANFLIDIMDDGIKSSKPGSFEYNSIGAGRVCSLTFNSNFVFQTIDCLLLPTDPGQ